MASYKTNRIIPVAFVLIVAAIAIAALVSLARVAFFSSGTTNTVQVDVSEEALLSTTVDRSVTMTVRGPIVANEAFHSYQITVTPSSRDLTTYTSYLDHQVDSIQLDNNIPGYEQFVYALNRADLVKGKQFTGADNDVRGICATGMVYQFTVKNGTQPVKELWTSTCGGSKGSLDASVMQLKNLFMTQIPGSQSLVSKVNL